MAIDGALADPFDRAAALRATDGQTDLQQPDGMQPQGGEDQVVEGGVIVPEADGVPFVATVFVGEFGNGDRLRHCPARTIQLKLKLPFGGLVGKPSAVWWWGSLVAIAACRMAGECRSSPLKACGRAERTRLGRGRRSKPDVRALRHPLPPNRGTLRDPPRAMGGFTRPHAPPPPRRCQAGGGAAIRRSTAAALSVRNTAANSAARRSIADSNRLRRLKLDSRAIQRRPQVAHDLRQRLHTARVDLPLIFQRALRPHDAVGVRAPADDGQHLGERLAGDRPAQADVPGLAHGNAQRHPVFGERDLDPVQLLAADFLDADVIDDTDAVRRIDNQVALAKGASHHPTRLLARRPRQSPAGCPAGALMGPPRVTTGNVTTFDATAGMAVGIEWRPLGPRRWQSRPSFVQAPQLWRAGALGDRPEGAPARGFGRYRPPRQARRADGGITTPSLRRHHHDATGSWTDNWPSSTTRSCPSRELRTR